MMTGSRERIRLSRKVGPPLQNAVQRLQKQGADARCR